jgi:endoglycosylceramidase
MMWPGVETARFVYNQTYIETMQQLVKNLAAKDIYTLLDCHQDLLSPKYCGEGVCLFTVPIPCAYQLVPYLTLCSLRKGVPDYAAIPNPVALKFPFPVLGLTGTLPIDNTTGYPETEACLKNPFFEYYFSQQASSAFQSLYDNKDYIRDSFGLFWEKVAYNFKGYDHVIGYELINEPVCLPIFPFFLPITKPYEANNILMTARYQFAGDIYVDPELLIVPGKADQQNLVKMYDELAAKIRAYDTDHLIWYEPVTNDAVLLSVGFAQPPGGAAYRNQSVFSYHVRIKQTIYSKLYSTI